LGRLEVGVGIIAFWRTKADISLKRVKMDEKLLWRELTNALSNGTILNPLWPSFPSSRLWVCNLAIPLISGRGKATDFKFGGYIYRTNPNKSPLKILEIKERGCIQGLPKFFGYPYYLRNG